MANEGVAEAVDRFFGDQNVQRLIAMSATWRPLQICFPREVNISRLLGWLLDPTEGHGLGDLAIQSLLARAWQSPNRVALPLAIQRFLSPASVYTEGFSSVLVTTEVELGSKSLDVLVVDPRGRRYIAIENKFGAKQSDDQLKDYREGLEELLPNFLGVHIFIDSNDAVPDDDGWVSVGYDWLAEFLYAAEQREATALHVRETLQQFRAVIEDEAEDMASSDAKDVLVTEVSSGHSKLLLEQMKSWQKLKKGVRAKRLAELMEGATTLEEKAKLRLFQLYWRRKQLWDECIRQAQFAPFVREMKKCFDEVLVSPKRVRTTFFLRKWIALADDAESGQLPAGITVRQTGETFRVVSYVQLDHISADKRDAVSAVAADARNGRKIQEDQRRIVIRRSDNLSKENAVKRALGDCADLHKVLEPVL